MKLRFIFLLIICFSIQKAFGISSEGIIGYSSQAHVLGTAPWHPQEFHIVYPNRRLTFLFPYETEQSGVSNLLFQCQETGTIRMLYTILDVYRFGNVHRDRRVTQFSSGMYDAILLYNSGNFVRYEGVVLYKGTALENSVNTVVANMREHAIQPATAESQQWLQLGSFYADEAGSRFRINTRIGYSNATESDVRIRGYVFIAHERDVGIPCAGVNGVVQVLDANTIMLDDGAVRALDDDGNIVQLSGTLTHRHSWVLFDGYFEIESEDINYPLLISCIWHFPVKIYVTGNAGVFVVTEKIPEGMPGAIVEMTIGTPGGLSSAPRRSTCPCCNDEVVDDPIQ